MTLMWAKLTSSRALHPTPMAGIMRTHRSAVRAPVLPTGFRCHNDMVKAPGTPSSSDITPEVLLAELVNTWNKRLHPPPPSQLRERCIGSAAELTEVNPLRGQVQTKESLPLTVNLEGRFFYHKISEEHRPTGWLVQHAREDLEQCFRSSPAEYFGLEAPIPILYMRETGYEYLIESGGRIYIWNIVGDELHQMVQPTTLEQLLDLMNDEKLWEVYRHRVWENPHTKWERIGMMETLPEHDV